MQCSGAMSSETTVHPPVPKPRVGKPHTTDPSSAVRKPDASRVAVSEQGVGGTSSQNGTIFNVFTQATPTPSKPQEDRNTVDQEPLSGGKEEGKEKPVVPRVRRRLPSVSSDEDSGPDYENIDEEDLQEAMQKSDYINWVYQESDSEGEDGGEVVEGERRHLAPFVPLKTHPLLKKSQSTNDIDHPTGSHASPAKKLSHQNIPSVPLKPGQEGFRPRNRAPPPPPPGLRQSKDRDRGREKPPGAKEKLLSGSPIPGHQRSQSDLPSLKLSGEHSGRRTPPTGRTTPSRPPPPPTQPPPPSRPPPPSHPPPPSYPPPSLHSQDSRLTPEPEQKVTEPHRKNVNSPDLRKKVPEDHNRNVKSPEAVKRNVKSPEELKVTVKSPELKSKQTEGGAGKGSPAMTEKYHHQRSKEHKQQDKRDKFIIREGFPNLKPKRHAPPPPPPGKKTPNSSPEDPTMGREESLEKPEEDTEDNPQESPVEKSTDDRGDRPPKPFRQRNSDSNILSGQTEEPLAHTEEAGPSKLPLDADDIEGVLDSMDIFTIELNRDGDKSLGMVIVSGKARSARGNVLEGVFVQKILPGSPADRDGRIQSGDMLVEIAGQPMVGGTLPNATQILKHSPESIRLKIGRPDTGSAVIDSSEVEEDEPIYVNELAGPAEKELFIKLEKAEVRIAELEGEKETAENDLKAFREAAENEQKNFHKQLEELQKEFEQHKVENKQSISDLTQALANITIEKTKADKELETLRELRDKGNIGRSQQVSALKQQLSDAREAQERIGRQLKDYRAKDEELASLNVRVNQLDSELTESRQQTELNQEEIRQLRNELDDAKNKVASLETRNQKLSTELELVRAENAEKSNVAKEFSQLSGELSAVSEELRQCRVENSSLSANVEALTAEVERERVKAVEYQDSLKSAKRSEKTSTADLLNKLQTQAKQIADLKAEIAAHEISEQQQQQQQKQQQKQKEPPPLPPPPSPPPSPPPPPPQQQQSDVEEKPAVRRELKPRKQEPEHELKPPKMVRPVAEIEGEPSAVTNISHDYNKTCQSVRKISHGEVVSLVQLEHTAQEKEGGLEGEAGGDGRAGGEAAVAVKAQDKHTAPIKEEKQPAKENKTSTVAMEFDDAVKCVKRLDSSTALHKSQVGAQLRRKKPSRDYIRSMGSLTDLLESVASIEEEEEEERKDEGTEAVQISDRAEVQSTSKPLTDVTPKVTPTHQPLQPPSVPSKPKPMPKLMPKPMPRVPPRQKTPTHKPEETTPLAPPEVVKRPQAAPRHKRERSDTSLIPEGDNVRHRTGSLSSTPTPSTAYAREESKLRDEDGKTTEEMQSRSSPKVEKREVLRPSPKHSPKLAHSSPKKQPLFPSPKHSPPPLRPTSKSLDNISEELIFSKEPQEASENRAVNREEPLLPKPTPRHQRQLSKEDRTVENLPQESKDEEITKKDPSELSVKEKALLAQQAIEKPKFPPPVPRKPSKPHLHEDCPPATTDSQGSPLRERAKSFDTTLEASPGHQAKKLPPGAFNLALPFGGSHGQIRGRSATVSTEEPDSREQSLEISGEHKEMLIHYFKTGEGPRDETDAPQRPQDASVPPKRPPPPFQKRPSDERVTVPTPKHYRQQEAVDGEVDAHVTQDTVMATNDSRPELIHSEDANPLLQAGVHGSSPEPEILDYNQVLSWTSDHVAAWLMKIGLGHYQQMFTDKGIQGFMLFDLDGVKLKTIGVTSSDDRAALKRELKVLKPYADKQKKLLDKQRKDEKKQAKKKKK